MRIRAPRTDAEPPRDGGIADELRALGIAWLLCDERGQPIERGEPSSGLGLCDALHRSPLVRQALRQRVPELLRSEGEGAFEALPGLFAVPVPEAAADRRGLGIALVPTGAFAAGDDLRRVALGAGADPGRLRAAMGEQALATAAELPRLAALIRCAARAERARDAERAAADAAGRELADTYEEINLLYTLVSGMAVAEEPGPFLALACDELVRTLGFPWVALRLRPPLDRFAENDGMVVAGEVPVSRDGMRDLATRMLLTCGAEGPRVLPRGHAVLAESALDGPVIVCPLRREGRAIGVLLAGDRDGEIVSAELKLVDATAGHLGLYLENASLYRDLDAMFLGTLEALVATIDAKDPYTRGHSQRVAALSRELGRRIGLDEGSLKRIHIAGLVHDVGKIGVAEAVLRKPGRLDDEEFAQIRMHPEIGWRILKDIPQFEGVLDGVLWHHERWDGRGYPHGLRGAAIPLFARIIALADSFDAMSTDRTYRAKRPADEVLAEILRCGGSQFDPELAGQFVGLDFNEYHRLRREHEDLAVDVRSAA